MGLLCCGGALLALLDGDITSAVTVACLGVVCVGAARSGRDPLNEHGAFQSFRVASHAEELENDRREDEAAR